MNQNSANYDVEMKDPSKDEPLLDENQNRYVLFPIKYPKIWDMYKKASQTFWTAENIEFQQDLIDTQKLKEDEVKYLKHILALFGVYSNSSFSTLSKTFCSDIKIAEARCFYGFQLAMENIHSEAYAIFFDTYITSLEERNQLFSTVASLPILQKMEKWASNVFSKDTLFVERVVAFAAVEAIFLSGVYAAIGWLNYRKLLPGLANATYLILKDQCMYCDFSCLVYSHMIGKLSDKKIIEIVDQAVQLEIELCTESIPVSLIGIETESIKTYVQFMADRILMSLGLSAYYNSGNPYEWVDVSILVGSNNTAENKALSFQTANMGKSEDKVFRIDEDF